MNHIDDILELIDAGLGSSTELDQCPDWRGLCWRCQERPAGDSFDGACGPCASWLVGEGDDPLDGRLPADWAEHLTSTECPDMPGVWTFEPRSPIALARAELTADDERALDERMARHLVEHHDYLWERRYPDVCFPVARPDCSIEVVTYRFNGRGYRRVP